MGLALRFAKTPSVPDPYVRVVVGANAGYCDTLLSTGGCDGVDCESEPGTNLLLGLSSSSSSSSEGESNVSAKVLSASSANGSLWDNNARD